MCASLQSYTLQKNGKYILKFTQTKPTKRKPCFQGAQKISLPYAQNKVLTVKQILSNFPNMDKVEKGPKEIFSPDIQKDLLLLEEQEGSVNFKFGVVYMKSGQTSDDEILSNGKYKSV